MNKGWIIDPYSPDFLTTAQLYLATGLWRFQCERLGDFRGSFDRAILEFNL
jgi:hypothetical protein